MKLFQSLVVFSATIVLVLNNESLSRGESNPDAKQAEQTIFGHWRADAVSMMVKPGERLTYPTLFDGRSFNVIITKNSLALWQGNQVLADIKYDSGSQHTAGTIDGQFQGDGVLGIYELQGDRLKISLNKVNKGRPQNYDDKNDDCVLILHRFEEQPLMAINADGGNLHPLKSVPGFTTCGSPNWSHDGSKIAFDCWRSIFNENYTQSRVFVVDSDGGSPKDLGDGALPSFSPDGKQIAYFRYNKGVWIMNADGSDKRLIDKDGTCARWSPKGNEVAYGTKNNLCIVDLKTDNRRTLLEKSYEQIAWGFCWSPDAKWICFKGDLPGGGAETALVNSDGESKGFKILVPSKAAPGLKSTDFSFSWSPDGKNILISTTMSGDANIQLYFIDPEGNTPPRKLAGQNPNCMNYCSTWSPDGKKIVLAFWPGVTPKNDNQDGSFIKRLFNW